MGSDLGFRGRDRMGRRPRGRVCGCLFWTRVGSGADTGMRAYGRGDSTGLRTAVSLCSFVWGGRMRTRETALPKGETSDLLVRWG